MNTEKSTMLARPYAIAAFEYALAKNDLAGWEVLLQAAAAVAENHQMVSLLHNPQVTHLELLDIFCEVLAKVLDPEKKNFLHLLAEYERLETLPEIAALFAEKQAEHDKSMTVQVASAVALTEEQKRKLIAGLSKRLQRQVSLECSIDRTLLGGAIIRAGDNVIDGSIRGKLNRLVDYLI